MGGVEDFGDKGGGVQMMGHKKCRGVCKFRIEIIKFKKKSPAAGNIIILDKFIFIFTKRLIFEIKKRVLIL